MCVALSLYILYPAASGGLPFAPDYSEWYDSLKSVLTLALSGSTSTIDISPALWSGLTNMQRVDVSLFFVVYIGFVLLSIILLLNLLIAMMSYTFEEVLAEC